MAKKALQNLMPRVLPFLSAAVLLLAPMNAWAEDVPVKIGVHDAYTRLVFEFPKLVPYHATKTQDGVVLDFDTPLGAASLTKMPTTLAGFSAVKPDAATLKITLTLKAGQDFKHYRLMRKIVLDVIPASPARMPEKKPLETAPPPVVEKKAPEPTKPVPTKPVPPPPEKHVEAPPPPPPIPAPAAAPVIPVVAEVPQEHAQAVDETAITFSSASPLHLAVFRRFGTLWIVTNDSTGGAFAPEASGLQAAFLGKPKTLRFKGGMAWRYPMPPETFVSVEKKGLTWNIRLTAEARPKIAESQARVDIDRASRKAKLVATLPKAGDVLSFEDPSAGDTLYVIPTDAENARVGAARTFADVQTLPAEMGFIVRPLADGVETTRLEDVIMISSPHGISATLTAGNSVSRFKETEEEEKEGEGGHLFDFQSWQRGGIPDFFKNRHALEEEAALAQSPDERQTGLIKLATLYFSNHFGHEALGALALAESDDEMIAKNPAFIALKGAASAMAGHYPEALQYLSNPAIQQHPEVNLWIGYAAAATEQWHMANRSFPAGTQLLAEYPDNVAIPFTIYMAESALRLGHADTADTLLNSIHAAPEAFSPQDKAALAYLKGESFRQRGNFDAAMEEWQPLADGIDRLYHTKASLALAHLQLQEKKITLKESIDKVDSLRFAWRGDGLEVQILQNLGHLKVRDGRYLDGLQDMKEAIMLADNLSNDSDPIHDDMRRVVADLFVGGQADKIDPLQAVSIYESFHHLLPQGSSDAAIASLRYSDQLVRMDLLSKAEKVFEDNLKAGLIPEEKIAPTGAKLAAIYLLDGKAEDALAALDKTLRTPADEKVAQERDLLRARALSQLDKTDAAIQILSGMDAKPAVALKVDVLWRARKWKEVATAIEALIPQSSQKLSDDDAKLIVNLAVSCRLAGDVAKLEDIKARYGAAMAETTQSYAFGVVVRANEAADLADHDTLLKMAGEVDMFKGFLDSYKASAGSTPPPASSTPATDPHEKHEE